MILDVNNQTSSGKVPEFLAGIISEYYIKQFRGCDVYDALGSHELNGKTYRDLFENVVRVYVNYCISIGTNKSDMKLLYNATTREIDIGVGSNLKSCLGSWDSEISEINTLFKGCIQ